MASKITPPDEECGRRKGDDRRQDDVPIEHADRRRIRDRRSGRDRRLEPRA